MQWEDISFNWAMFACYGVAQVLVTLAICMPLERWRPVERWPDNHAVWTDIFLHAAIPYRRAAAGDLRAVLRAAGFR